MTDAEKWRFHTDIYAFRRVHLGIHDTISPCDPDGRWHDPALVEPAERRTRADRGKRAEPGEVDRDAWARSHGWQSWLERQDAIEAFRLGQQRGLAWQAEHADELRALGPIGRLARALERRATRRSGHEN